MRLEIRDTNRYGPLTEARLRRFEGELGVRLPEDYRRFILTHNGGRPMLSRFHIDVDGEQQESILEWFFALHDRPEETDRGWSPDDTDRLPPYFSQSIEAVWHDFQAETPARELLPFARDPGGNLVCLEITGRNAGRVLFHRVEGCRGREAHRL